MGEGQCFGGSAGSLRRQHSGPGPRAGRLLHLQHCSVMTSASASCSTKMHEAPPPSNFTHLVLAALAGLEAGQDLALDHLHPSVALLVRSGLEMPRLPRQRHDGELEVLLLFWRREKTKTRKTGRRTQHPIACDQYSSRDVLLYYLIKYLHQ